MPKEDKQIFNIPALSRKKTRKRAPSLWEFNPDDFRDLIRRRREKKFVVALSAGKLKIAAHLPLLRLLETLEIEVDELWGVSAGSIVGGLWASGMTVKQIDKALDELNLSLMFDAFNFKAMRTVIDSLIQEQPIKTAGLFPGINIEKHLRELSEMPKKPNPLIDIHNYYAVAYNMTKFHKTVFSPLEDGKIRHLNLEKGDNFTESESDGDIADIMRASMAMSGIYWPKEIDEDFFLDGGITEHLPIRTPFLKWLDDVNMKKEKRDLFILANEAAYWDAEDPPPANPLSVISESFEILGVELSMDHELFIKDYKTLRGPKVDLEVIRPRMPYTRMTEIPDFTKQIEAAKELLLKALKDK